MSIIWFSEKNRDGVATIYDGNITLNKIACKFVEQAYRIMLGIDAVNRLVFIKPLSKAESTRGDIPEESQYKITVRASYGRVANIDFIKQIKRIIKVDQLKDHPKKFYIEWKEKEKLLVIDLSKEVSQ